MSFRETLDRLLARDFSGATQQEREESAKQLIMVCSLAASGLVLQPVPGLETAAIPIQIAMVGGIAKIFGEELSRKRVKEIVMDIGAITGVNVAGRQALTTLAKLALPGLGGMLAAPTMFAVCYGTGHAAIHYFKSGGKPDRQRIKEIFEREKRRAKDKYSESAARRSRPGRDDLNG